MTRRIGSLFVITALFASNLAAGQDAAQASPDTAYGKLMLAGHPIGSMIEVILAQKEHRITGRLIAVSENSFEIEVAKAHQFSRRTILFADVKNIVKHGMSSKKKAAIAAAVVAAVLGALAATFSGGMR